MANKRELRVIARNLVAISALSASFDVGDELSDADQERLHQEIRSVSRSVVKSCYQAENWSAPAIVREVLDEFRNRRIK